MKNPLAVFDNILVQDLSEDAQTESGIILPGSGKQLPQAYGVCLSKGKEVADEIEIGDKLVFHQSAGQFIVPNISKPEEILRVLKPGEVYAVVEREVK